MSILMSLLGPRRGFDGGLFLPEFKSVTAKRPIETVAASGVLRIPLQRARGLETVARVRIGERVLRGQCLALAARTESLPVHAPTSGRIVGMEDVATARDGVLPGVILEADGLDEGMGPGPYWEEDSFSAQLASCGVLCPSPRMSAHVLLQRAVEADAEVLIVNAMETEPHLTADLRTLVEQPGRMIDAACEISDAMGARRVIIALADRHRRVLKRIAGEAAGRHVEVVPLADRYPQCHPIVLVKTLLDIEISPGGDVLDAGALVLPLAAVRGIADAILDGRPSTHAVLSIAGDAIEHPGTYRVAVGTPVAELLSRVGLLDRVNRAVAGGPLTGVALEREDVVVTADLNGLLFYSGEGTGRASACIHCGWCVEDCPVGIEPVGLMFVENDERCDEETLSHLQACIDCGLCSYVCPAEIPLASSIARGRARFSGAEAGDAER